MGIELNNNGPLSPVGAKLFGADAAGNGGHFAASAYQRDALVTVAVGNSIAAQSKHTGSYWTTKAEVHLANLLCKSAMRFKRMTASTRADVFGVYGYSGQTLPTMYADLEAQLWTPLATAGVVPELVIGLALLENDISSGATVAAMTASVKALVRDVQARYPGASLLLCTPRPNFSNDTAGKVAAYQGIRDYILSLDDGASIVVARLDGYENPASLATPLSGYTDASVHPNAKGAWVNAKVIAAAVQRLGVNFRRGMKRVSNNMALTGSGAASGTNVTGTVPTSFTSATSIYATYVATAENPGVTLAYSGVTATGSEPPADLGASNAGSISISGATQISPFIEIEIVSGAENISFIQLDPRINDGGVNTFQYFLQRQTNDANVDFQNGDILTFVRPPAIANLGSITAVTNYIRALPKITGGDFAFRVLSQGVEVVA